MDTHVMTPQAVFSQPQHLEVPVFQRRYVWEEETQWGPLWDDIQHVAQARLDGRAEPHFLGAVVTQTSGAGMGLIARHSLIDGQQRLTTLQLVLDAAAAELSAVGLAQHAARLTTLTHNDESFGTGVDSLKLQHQNDDRSPFVAVMQAESPVAYADLPSSRIVQAHEYFAGRVRDWLGEEPEVRRAEALVGALTMGLQIVVISLGEQENSQEIFETLNARGTPLTAADLIKNFVFQQIAQEGGDVKVAFDRRWRRLERPFWTHEVPIGRYRVERVSLFLNHWLVAQTGEEVSTRSTFVRFQRWFRGEQQRSMEEVLDSLVRQADLFQSWITEANDRDGDISDVALFVYRTEAADIEAVKPLLLWLFDVDRGVPEDSVRRALGDVESWIMRRSLMRLPASEYSRRVAGIISALRAADGQDAAAVVRQELMAFDRQYSYWPGDRELREHLLTAPIYQQPKRRVGMYLEAVEDHMRGYTSGSPTAERRVSRNKMTIEHLLPRSWKTNWPVDDLAAEIERDAHVHRLGNLTLLTGPLNSAVSNASWLGPKGKRQALERSDTLLLTRAPRSLDEWTEGSIDSRSADLVTRLVETWPVPPGHDPATPGSDDSPQTYLVVPIKELVAKGVLAAGTELRGTRYDTTYTATVTAEGELRVGSDTYDTPSGAGKAAIGRGVNGWRFWRLPDGRQLRELTRQEERRGEVEPPPVGA